MNRLIRSFLFLITLIAMICAHSSTIAQNEHWREIKGKPLIKFDGNCASASVYPMAKLGRLVEASLKREGGTAIPDRAFAFDLNNDGRPEYFVPLVCGATGN